MFVTIVNYIQSISLLQETTLYGCTVRINEPVGVVGIACPDDYPLLSFVSLFSPAVVRGNTIIIIPSEKYPLSATDLYQVTFSSQPRNYYYMCSTKFLLTELRVIAHCCCRQHTQLLQYDYKTTYTQLLQYDYTVEPPNNGQGRAGGFVRYWEALP